jgi:hypothetical protein
MKNRMEVRTADKSTLEKVEQRCREISYRTWRPPNNPSHCKRTSVAFRSAKQFAFVERKATISATYLFLYSALLHDGE